MVEISWKGKTPRDIWWDFTLAETVFSSIISIVTNLRWQEFNVVQFCFSTIIAVIFHGYKPVTVITAILWKRMSST